jgi:hypothetical protein
MKYRGSGDKRISVYAALLVITIAAASATLLILQEIKTINFSYVAQAEASTN